MDCCSVSKLCPTLRSRVLQHSTLPCLLPSPRARSNSCPLSQWGHPTISSSVAPSPLVFNPSQHQEYFPVSQLFTSGGQNIGASAPASALPVNIQGWYVVHGPRLYWRLPSLAIVWLTRWFSGLDLSVELRLLCPPWLRIKDGYLEGDKWDYKWNPKLGAGMVWGIQSTN